MYKLKLVKSGYDWIRVIEFKKSKINVTAGIFSTLPIEDVLITQLTKSLGINVTRIQRNLEDAKFREQYLDLYKEMLKAGQELEDTPGRISDIDPSMIKGIANRRRAVSASPVGNRRARSQALRREKLNSQSMRSHQVHSRLASLSSD
ncbi:unnamed protein product [Leptidea sinapis]|uniref:Uncharacterized protein n=1 Tax=Leptidea sinapis TaxID=189913 RepID=A0A5E4Q6W9_9NEOP|nr:unnamed protein product [Leptidea sinapis]